MIRVLIVDNNTEMVSWLSDQLAYESDGRVIATPVLSAQAARVCVAESETPFDAFLIDQFLDAGTEGIDLMQELMHLSPDTETIIFTGATDDPAIGLRAYQAGAYDYLKKPFEVKELAWQLGSLYALRMLNDAAQQAQSAKSFTQIADVITRYAQQLGFERAHLWMLNEDKRSLTEISRAGNIEIPRPTGPIPLHASPYARKAIDSQHELLLFEGEELGPGYYLSNFPEEYKKPVGTWPLLSLKANNEFIGLLILDNAEMNREIHAYQCRLLRLFARQAAAALVRAHEQEQRDLVRRVSMHVSKQAADRNLDKLLRTVRNQIGTFVDTQGFMVALLSQEGQSRFLDYRLRYDNGTATAHTWRKWSKRGLVEYVIENNQPQFLPYGVDEFRRKHGLKPFGKPAQSFMAVPLRVQGRPIGVIALEDNHVAGAYTRKQFDLLRAVANDIQGVIHMTCLEEEEAQHNQALSVLQQASKEITRLAEAQDESTVWHVALTVATANYGLKFNRAMAFLSEGGGTQLHACAGIGHIKPAKARTDWEKDKEEQLTFAKYLARLLTGDIPPTPLQALAKDWKLTIGGTANAFKTVLTTGKPRVVSAQTAKRYLPAEFVAQLGSTDYAVLPLKASNKIVGLVVLDNAHNIKPISMVALRHLEPLLTQTALTIENLRQRRTQDKLVAITQKALSGKSDRPLKERLDEICETFRSVAGAECALIYPLADQPRDRNKVFFDTAQAGSSGDDEGQHLVESSSISHIMANALRRELLTVDVAKDPRSYGQTKLRENPFIQHKGIRGVHGRLIEDSETGERLGALMFFHALPIKLGDAHESITKSFAGLAAAAIQNTWAAQRMHVQKTEAEADVRTRDEEMRGHRIILDESLRPDTTEDIVIRCILGVGRAMLDGTDAHVEVMLKTWKRQDEHNEEPRNIREEYWIDTTQSRPVVECHDESDLYRGIAGDVFRDGQWRCATNVHDGTWPQFYGRPETRSELAVPIRLRGTGVIGVIVAESPFVGAFIEDHIQVFERLTDVAALALDNVQRQMRATEVLKATQTITAPIDAPATFNAITEVLLKVVPDLSALSIWYLNPKNEKLKLGVRFGTDEPSLDTEIGVDETDTITQVMKASKPIYAPDAKSATQSEFVKRQHIESLAAFPLQAEGQNFGAMFINFRHDREFTSDEKQLVSALASIAAASIRDALLYDYAVQQTEWLNVAQKVGEATATVFGQDDVLRRILSEVKTLYPITEMCIYTYNKEKRQLEVTPASKGFYTFVRPEDAPTLALGEQGQGIAGKLAQLSEQTGKIEVINVGDISTVPDFVRGAKGKMRSELCATLVATDGQLLGALILENPELNAYNMDDEEKIRLIARQISIAIERDKLGQQLRFNFNVAAATSWAARLAHDLKSTISDIRDHTYWLWHNYKDLLPSDGQESLAEVEARIQDLATAVDASALPSLSGSESINLEEFLPEVIQQVPLKKRKTHIVYDFESTDLKVQANRYNLSEVVRHMVQNAVKAMDDYGVLTIKTRKTGMQWVQVQFCDTGVGIPPEVIPKLFQERFTTSGSSNGGLGLLFVRNLMEQMDGFVQLVETQVGQGSIFAISLRIA